MFDKKRTFRYNSHLKKQSAKNQTKNKLKDKYQEMKKIGETDKAALIASTNKNYFKKKINKITKNYALRLEEEIENYFKYCDGENEKVKPKFIKPYTLSGLCCHLGISRSDIDVLLTNNKSKHTVSNAKLRIENFIEENLLNGRISAASGVIALKYNFNWTDKAQKDANSGETYDVAMNPEYSE